MSNSNESNLAEGIGFKPGETIGRYEVISRIAIGGQSIIYKCHDPSLDRMVAIKQISTHLAEDKMFLDRFRTEAQILARLGAEQPEVVTIHDLLENKQGLFIVMEFVEGISLELTLSSNPGPVELKATLQILWRLCSALHTVHTAGVIHRDIKPSNVIIADGLRPMITDFGVAATSSGEASMVMGSTKYMAPELFTGGYVDGRADMYSLGFIAYEMLVGREKFNEIFADIVRDRSAEKVRWMKWHSNPKVTAPPPHEVNSAIPITLSNIVLKMIAKDSEQRFEGMEALGRAIKLTFKPGAGKAAGGQQAPVASPVEDGDTLSLSADQALNERVPFETEDAVTAPIPKRQLSLGVKIGIAAAAMLILGVGVFALMQMKGPTEVVDPGAAAKAWRAARNLYKNDQAYVKAEAAFLDVQKNYAGTQYAETAQVYIHLCREYVAIQKNDWSRAQAQEDSADILTKKIQKDSEVGSKLYEWTVTMRRSIKAVAAERLDKKAFFDTMNEAEAMFAAGKYDEATEHLEDAYPEPANLNEDQQHALTAFEKKVLRTVSMNVCKALMDKARSTDSSDADAAFQAWDEASAGLQKHKANIDPFIWSKMNSEVLRERAKLSKNLGYAKVLKAIDDARKEGDPTRIMRALTIGMDNPLVPANVRESWKREIETIKVKLEFDAITRLLVEDREVEAIEALEGFTKKHPTHTKSANVLRALKIKIGNRETRKTALDTFASGNYAKALPLLQALRAKNRGDREINEKIKTCQFELAMVKFAAAEAAMNYPEAMKVGEEARMYNPDSFDARIAPRLAVMQAKLKVQATLADGEKALKEGRYRDVRTILKNLSGSYPAAARTIEKSRYRENLGKGHAARAEGDLTTAKAMYKIAKKYAKDPAELTEINTLISALSEGT